MNEKNLKILALFIVLILPVFFLLVFKPLSKIPRPKAPHKMFATGVKEITNDKGDKVLDSTYHVIPNYKLQTQSGDSLELDSLYGNICVVLSDGEFYWAAWTRVKRKQEVSIQ